MAYCACADPGQVKQTRKMKIGAVGGMDIEEGIHRRAHKSWQYSRPIRRYDHCCKWVKNDDVFEYFWPICNNDRLLNHREFVIMVAGLLLIEVLGIMVDIWLAIGKRFWQCQCFFTLFFGQQMQVCWRRMAMVWACWESVPTERKGQWDREQI